MIFARSVADGKAARPLGREPQCNIPRATQSDAGKIGHQSDQRGAIAAPLVAQKPDRDPAFRSDRAQILHAAVQPANRAPHARHAHARDFTQLLLGEGNPEGLRQEFPRQSAAVILFPISFRRPKNKRGSRSFETAKLEILSKDLFKMSVVFFIKTVCVQRSTIRLYAAKVSQLVNNRHSYLPAPAPDPVFGAEKTQEAFSLMSHSVALKTATLNFEMQGLHIPCTFPNVSVYLDANHYWRRLSCDGCMIAWTTLKKTVDD